MLTTGDLLMAGAREEMESMSGLWPCPSAMVRPNRREQGALPILISSLVDTAMSPTDQLNAGTTIVTVLAQNQSGCRET